MSTPATACLALCSTLRGSNQALHCDFSVFTGEAQTCQLLYRSVHMLVLVKGR